MGTVIQNALALLEDSHKNIPGNPIIKELQAFAEFDLGKYANAFHAKKLADACSVQCVPMADVFTKQEIRMIRRILRPKKHHCYNNALDLAALFPDRVQYVEGLGWNGVCSIAHAFNKADGKYIDITFEMVLKIDVTKQPYVSLIEAEWDDVMADVEAHDNTTGDYYQHKYIESIGGKDALVRMMDEQAVANIQKGGPIVDVMKKAGTL